MLQKDGFFRKRDERREEQKREDNLFRPTTQAIPATPVAANTDPEATLPVSSAGITAPADRKEAKLVVGPDIKLKGVEISDCDTLIVEGRVEATLDSRVLEITPNGVFQGTIAVDNAEIHGRFEGELTVRKQLVIYSAGKVSGKIRYAKIKVEEGAELSGEISMLDKAAAGIR
ncbi:MAG TPA: polymer-forming cytoskeletal protein, partial [Burkholderiales bacterium]